MKFDMPNAFTVYLHDTPSRSLFGREERWLSHGCMRLELPRDLAAALLGPQGWSRAKVEAAIATGATRRVELAKPMPVFVVHRTAVADDSGAVTFRRDVYGWDAKLAAAMAGS
jgi:murein L,D-transpeptidase YcbB/YkuD